MTTGASGGSASDRSASDSVSSAGAGPSTGAAADAARATFRAELEAPGHAVDNAHIAVTGLDAAIASGALHRTDRLDQMRADLMVALEQDDGQRLGGKSAEAARFILRAMARELDNA